MTGGNTIGAAQVSTLELASAGSAGTLSGLGTQFVDFAQVTVDAGAQWILAGANTLVAGATLTNAGTLTDAGTLTNAGTLSGPLTLAAGGVLSNASTGTITASGGTAVYGTSGGAATVVNAGVIAGSDIIAPAESTWRPAATSPTKAAARSLGLTGLSARPRRDRGECRQHRGVTTLSAGIYLLAGGSVTNQSGGSISGYYGIYGDRRRDRGECRQHRGERDERRGRLPLRGRQRHQPKRRRDQRVLTGFTAPTPP